LTFCLSIQQEATKIIYVNLILISLDIHHVAGIQTALHLWAQMDWILVDMNVYRSINKGRGMFLTFPDDPPSGKNTCLYYLWLIQTTLPYTKLSAFI
jgi:hypothetical protein